MIESRHRTMFRLCPGQERTSIRRRVLLMGGFAGAIGCVFPPAAHAATAIVLPTAAANRRFSVLYKGFRIGNHTISYSPATGETRVRTEIHIEVKVAFVTAYAFSHRSEEIWRAGRLVSLNSDTRARWSQARIGSRYLTQGRRMTHSSSRWRDFS